MQRAETALEFGVVNSVTHWSKFSLWVVRRIDKKEKYKFVRMNELYVRIRF